MVMGSVGTPNPWGPYDTSKDCSQRVCSIYCPQWCYIYFPPPPPFDPKGDDSGSPLSPLIIAVISILAIAFLLVGYYTIISKYCKRRGDRDPNPELDQDNLDQIAHDQWQVASAGLDVTLIKSITVCKYKKDEGLVEGTDCAVCLSEFQEDESLRLLPRCSHAFHLPCIDTWLKSHSTCPLCRANIVLSNPLPLPAPNQQNSSSLNISSLEFQHQDDLILVVEDDEERCHQERAVMSFDNEIIPKNAEMGNNTIEIGEDNVQQLRRSVSLGSFTPQRQLLIADILRIDGNEEDLQLQIVEFPTGISSSKRSLAVQSMSNNTNWEMVRGPAGMMRTVSTGRFVFTEYGRRNNTVFSN